MFYMNILTNNKKKQKQANKQNINIIKKNNPS